MNAEARQELEAAIRSDKPLNEIVALLRRYKQQGISQGEVYSFLEALHKAAPDEATDDRVLEVADFVAGFCAPHMKVWEEAPAVIEDLRPCSPAELQAQIAYLRSTPVAGIGEALAHGQCKFSKGVVRSLALLGSLKTEFGQLGTMVPPITQGEQKFRISEVLPVLRQLPEGGGDLLARIKRFLKIDEADIEYNVTVVRIGGELIVKDGNARAIAFYERRKGTQDGIDFPIFLVEIAER